MFRRAASVKHPVLFAFFAFLLLTTYYFLLTTTALADGERILSYVVHIELQKNGSAVVQEEILYDFGSVQKHGIFRKIPLMFNVPGVGRISQLELSSMLVTDGMGNYRPTQYTHGANVDELKIGDPDVLVSGKQLYVIRYTVWNALYELENKAEFYWNATGNEWPSPIDRTRAEIVLPSEFTPDIISYSCYSGRKGSSRPCANASTTAAPDPGSSSSVRTVVRFEDANLGAGEGLTVAVGFPKGVINVAGTPKKGFGVGLDFAGALITMHTLISMVLPLAVFMVMFRVWWTNGRDPKERGSVMPEYDVPENLSPIRAGALFNDGIGPKTITAGIIELARKGYLRIERIEKNALVFGGADFSIRSLKKPDMEVELEERLILDGLFSNGQTSVRVSSLAHKLVDLSSKVNKSVFAELTDGGLYVTNPQTARGTYFLGGSGVLILGIFLGWTFIASGVIIMFFGWFMGKKSTAGIDLLHRLKGFRMYLEIAEADRIRFANAPSKSPEMFEKFLPYAMIFGIEKEWAEQFKDMYIPADRNHWYASGSGRLGSSDFVKEIGKFSTLSAVAFTAQSRGGASGGGGFSGGGGGGGGGGSW